MIAVISPTRGRPEGFKRMVESVRKTAKDVIICSGSNGNDTYVANQYPIDMPTVYMWNDLAIKAMTDNPDIKLFMLGSDDMIFATPEWDKALLDHYDKLRNKIHVYHLQDSRDTEGIPHPVVSREYISALGYFMPPLFNHWFVDTWTVKIARANKCFTHLKDYLLIHDKPSDRGEADETHNNIRRMGWHLRDSYVSQACKHYLNLEIQRIECAFG